LGGALLLGSAACDDKITNTLTLVGTNITVSTASNGQVGVVGQPLPQPIVVHVSDQNGASLANAPVRWTVLFGGGSVSSPTSLTDANGDASVTWTMGPTVGVDSLQASIATGASVIITATATAGPLATINKTSGDNQTVLAGTTSAPMVVTLVDPSGNPIVGATVTWTTTSTGTLSATSTTTDANGQTQVTLATGAVPATATVTAASGTATPVTFTIVGT
jgi:adhesin/invasin